MKWKLKLTQNTSFFPGLAVNAVFFAAGAVVAAVLVNCAGHGAPALGDYIKGYMRLSQEGALTGSRAGPVFLNVFKYHAAAFFLGFTFLGAVLLPILSAIRGFFLSFAVAAFAHVFGGEGILAALAVLGLNTLLTLPCFFLIAAESFRAACSLFDNALDKQRRAGAIYGGTYFRHMLACAAVLAAAALAELFITPHIVASVAALVL